MVKRYIQMRHWDYWYGVFHLGDQLSSTVDGAEFSLTEDMDGDKLFFHFDFYGLAALEQMLSEGSFIAKEDSNYQQFLQQGTNLKMQKEEYFIGALYYRDFSPSIEECRLKGRSVFELKSPKMPPYYAVIFLNENRPLVPEVLKEWLQKLSPQFFGTMAEYVFSYVPTQEQAFAAYQGDLTL